MAPLSMLFMASLAAASVGASASRPLCHPHKSVCSHHWQLDPATTVTHTIAVEATATETRQHIVEHTVTERPFTVTKPVTADPHYSISATTKQGSPASPEPTSFSWIHMGATYTTTVPASAKTVVLDVYGPVVVQGTSTSTHSTTTTTITLPAEQTAPLIIER